MLLAPLIPHSGYVGIVILHMKKEKEQGFREISYYA